METATDPIFGDVISRYTRSQAIEDGVLVDLSEWAGRGENGMLGGFSCPVAVTQAVWSEIKWVPKSGAGSDGDVRGRAHDVLWMARCAARGARPGVSELLFRVSMPIGKGGPLRTYKLVAGPGDEGELVMTIMLPHED